MALKPNEQELLDRVQSGLGIGGTWQPSTTGATIDVHDPATGEVIKQIADATVEDAVRARLLHDGGRDGDTLGAGHHRKVTTKRMKRGSQDRSHDGQSHPAV